MKRIVASVGVVALGAAVMQTSNAQGISGDASKAWTISAALRGFYDDNVNTSNNNEIDTFGFEVSPSIGFNVPLDQTTFSLVYTYAYKYYDKRPTTGVGGATGDHDDQTHTVNARLMHAFSERTTASLRNSFVIGQEPDVLRAGDSANSLYRISGDNIRNYASATFNHQVTPIFGVELGYDNTLFDYDADVYSRILDRVEHRAHLDGRWSLANNSIALVGYAFGAGCYTEDAPNGFLDFPANTIRSTARNYNSHYGYVGLEHTFRPDLFGSVRVGANFRDYYNSPDDESTVSPYVQASLRYTYAQDSNLQIGVSHDMSATDRFDGVTAGGSIATDSETTVVYGSITHAITPSLTGTLMATFQNNIINGGPLDNDTEQFYIFNAALAYQINRHLSATVSYNFDHLESDQNVRTYDRNRVYLGAVFTY